jgi:dTDP-4-amino-4,6-dideoxygalactose transaminase
MILMNDFKSEPEELIQSELKAMERVVRSGWYVLGNEVNNFEVSWAEKCKINHAIAVGNGMDAIEIGLRTLDIGPGDEVITTSMTAFATVLAILRAGAIPVLADIDPDTALISKESVNRCLSQKTKAVLIVHLYGQLRDMNLWVEFCQEHKILLLEDCAQSHLAEQNGSFAGSFGAFGAYSFYPTKNLGALGDGGAIIYSDLKLAEKAKVLRNYGQSIRYHHPEIGLNSRLDELQAAILMARLDWLEEFTKRRKEIANKLYASITNSKIFLLSKPQEPNAHVYHLFVILCKERDLLQKHLNDAGIQSLIHYPIPIHHQKRCIEIKRDSKGLLNSEDHAKYCLSLPCHPQMSDDDILAVISAVNSF